MKRLAHTFQNLERWDEAGALILEALNIEKKIFGEENVDTLASMVILSEIANSQKRFHQAEELLRKVWDGRKKTLGEDNSETWVTMGKLATTYKEQGPSN
jgi:hypothetical protein